MARIEDLEDVGYRVKYDDAGEVVAIVGPRGEPSPFVLTTKTLTGRIELSIPLVVVQKFPDFAPSIIGSMAAGATYGQAGNTVTVTHTAHGLPTGKEGYRFYWPGSVAIPAGWFPGFSRIDANTFSFTNKTEQSVSSGTAITGALPVSGLMSLGSITVGKGTVDEFGSLVIGVSRGGDTSASTKSVKAYLNGNVIADNGLSTTPFGRNAFTVSRVGVSGTIGMRLTDNQHFGSGNYLLTTAQADFTNSDVVVNVRMSVATVSGWVSVDNLSLSFMP